MEKRIGLKRGESKDSNDDKFERTAEVYEPDESEGTYLSDLTSDKEQDTNSRLHVEKG